MTIEELKTEAEKLGYRIVKKEKYVSLLPCTCGQKKPHQWYWASRGHFFECPNCGKKSEPSKIKKQARLNWNKEVSTTQN